MSLRFFAVLLTLNYLQLIWFLGNKKYTSSRQTKILTLFLVSHLLFFSLFHTPFIVLFLFLFVVLQPIFIVRHLNNWLLMALFLYLESALIILSWLFTYDFPVYLLRIGKLSVALHQQLFPFLLIGQQLLLFTLICFVKRLDQKFNLFDSISHVQKNYKKTVLFLTFLLVLLYFLRQFAVYTISYSSFLYLTVILLGFNSVFHFTVYLYSRYYQEQLRKSVLSQQYNKDLDKITLADEFRHDYRSILVSLMGYIEEDRMEEASAFISSVTDYSKNLLEEDRYDQLNHLAIPPVQGLFLHFIESCEANGIDVNILIPQKIQETDISMRLIDFIRCMSAILDYAVNTKSTVLYLSLTKQGQKLDFRLTNNDSKVSSIDNLTTSKKSIKKAGLVIIPKILNHYRETSFSFLKDDLYFSILFSSHIPTTIFTNQKESSRNE